MLAHIHDREFSMQFTQIVGHAWILNSIETTYVRPHFEFRLKSSLHLSNQKRLLLQRPAPNQQLSDQWMRPFIARAL